MLTIQSEFIFFPFIVERKYDFIPFKVENDVTLQINVTTRAQDGNNVSNT